MPKKGTTNNPSGKGGFKDRPEDINREGRPKAGETMADIVKEILATEVEIKENGQIIRVTYRRALAKRLIINAMEGKDTSLKTVMSYDSGMPNQPITLGNLNPEDFVEPDDQERIEQEVEDLLLLPNDKLVEAMRKQQGIKKRKPKKDREND